MIPRIVLAVSLVCWLGSANAAAPERQQNVKVVITAACKPSFYGHAFVEGGDAAMKTGHSFAVGGAAAMRTVPSYALWDPKWAKPMVYKDPLTSIFLYVETDGRHVAAIDSRGKLLWVRNPYQQAGLCPYRTPRPVIYSIKAADSINTNLSEWIKKVGGNPNGRFVSITFDSSQFGLLDEHTGRFIFEGQN